MLPGGKNGFHNFGAASYFLLVATIEFFDFQIGKQPLDLAVGELAALDAGGGADALDGGNRRSALSRSGARLPRARQAPLNSSISDSNTSNSGGIWIVSVFNM